MSTRSHVFISYVREDSVLVDQLCSDIADARVEIWRDKTKIRPGERWQVAVRRAIEEGAFFIACFSESYGQRTRSYMNEELALAVEELRRRPADRVWFIPVLLEGGAVPDRPIGGGETLRDIQWVDLAADWRGGITRILEVLADVPPDMPARRSGDVSPVVVMVSDMVGSSLFTSAVLEKTARSVLDPAKAVGGRVAEFWGDSAAVAFRSPLAATQAASEIRRRFAGERRAKGPGIRIGIAAGTPASDHDKSLGGAIEVASRLCSVAEAGEVLLAESIYRCKGADRLPLRRRGLVAIKGLAHGIVVYELPRGKWPPNKRLQLSAPGEIKRRRG